MNETLYMYKSLFTGFIMPNEAEAFCLVKELYSSLEFLCHLLNLKTIKDTS